MKNLEKSTNKKSRKTEFPNLFLPGELEDLAESTTPQPGDVLLLDGHASTSLASRITGASKFSHVGIVVGSDLYIDAVSHEGVQIRPLADIYAPEQRYAVDRCEVARNPKIVLEQMDVWNAAFEYYKRPYRLRSIFMRRGGSEVEDDPVICSKLVAMILDDLGFGLSRRAVQRTFPRHLDIFCNPPYWWRFPLRDYDLFKNPDSFTALRKQALESQLKNLEPLHEINRRFKALINSHTQT